MFFNGVFCFSLFCSPEEETIELPLEIFNQMVLISFKEDGIVGIKLAYLMTVSVAACGRASEGSTTTFNDIRLRDVHNTFGLTVGNTLHMYIINFF